MTGTTTKWPKVLPPVTPGEQGDLDDFMRRGTRCCRVATGWSIGSTTRFRCATRSSRPGFRTTIEIGAGLGEHLSSRASSAEQEHDYVAVELRENMADRLSEAHPRVQAIVGDCQQRLPVRRRLLRSVPRDPRPRASAKPAGLHRRGVASSPRTAGFLVVIPCEGGLAYSLARRFRRSGSSKGSTGSRTARSSHASTSIAHTRSSVSSHPSSRSTPGDTFRLRSFRQSR